MPLNPKLTMSEPTYSCDGKRYLKKFEIVETDVELPIQGQVRDPVDPYKFMKDLENEQVPKVIAIYLDDNNLFLGHQVFLGASSNNFDTQLLYHYYALCSLWPRNSWCCLITQVQRMQRQTKQT
jgi:hypothetical protein